MARDVNQVWNFLNELSHRSIRERSVYMTSFDLQKYTSGFSKIDGVTIGSHTVQEVGAEYAARRKQFKRKRLNWRVSNRTSPKYSLGWVPFKTGAAKYKSGQIQFLGHKLGIWDSYGLGQYELRAGNFSEDSRGRWYFNASIQAEGKTASGTDAVGIDLGLKAAATTSDGDVLVGRQYRATEQKIGLAQRAGKKSRVRALYAKIRNQRQDAGHKFTTQMARRYAAVFVGDVASANLVKTKMAKSTLDAGWSRLKTMLKQKCQRAGVVFEVVDERYTTQTCSCCGVISSSSPKGRAGLRIRKWTCVGCGTAHDRDINAARNILAAGHRRLAVGISAIQCGEDVNRKGLLVTPNSECRQPHQARCH
jgi:IS605 OrfB family transposase